MKNINYMKCSLLVIALLFVAGKVAAQGTFQDMPPGFEAVTDAEIPWISGPDYPGSELAFLYGNPAEPGFYVMRVKFLSGTMSTPHYHDQERFITVLQGTWWVGMSTDLGDIEPMNPGGFMVHPAGAVHFDGSVTGETIIEVRGMGPVLTTSVQGPSD